VFLVHRLPAWSRKLGQRLVKAGATVTASDFAALKALQDQLGKQFRAGVVLYLGDQIVPFGDPLWLVPRPALWEH
jgi:uncharacterized protein